MWTYVFSFLGYKLRSRIAGSYGNSTLTFGGNATVRFFEVLQALIKTASLILVI